MKNINFPRYKISLTRLLFGIELFYAVTPLAIARPHCSDNQHVVQEALCLNLSKLVNRHGWHLNHSATESKLFGTLPFSSARHQTFFEFHQADKAASFQKSRLTFGMGYRLQQGPLGRLGINYFLDHGVEKSEKLLRSSLGGEWAYGNIQTTINAYLPWIRSNQKRQAAAGFDLRLHMQRPDSRLKGKLLLESYQGDNIRLQKIMPAMRNPLHIKGHLAYQLTHSLQLSLNLDHYAQADKASSLNGSLGLAFSYPYTRQGGKKSLADSKQNSFVERSKCIVSANTDTPGGETNASTQQPSGHLHISRSCNGYELPNHPLPPYTRTCEDLYISMVRIQGTSQAVEGGVEATIRVEGDPDVVVLNENSLSEECRVSLTSKGSLPSITLSTKRPGKAIIIAEAEGCEPARVEILVADEVELALQKLAQAQREISISDCKEACLQAGHDAFTAEYHVELLSQREHDLTEPASYWTHLESNADNNLMKAVSDWRQVTVRQQVWAEKWLKAISNSPDAADQRAEADRQLGLAQQNYKKALCVQQAQDNRDRELIVSRFSEFKYDCTLAQDNVRGARHFATALLPEYESACRWCDAAEAWKSTVDGWKGDRCFNTADKASEFAEQLRLAKLECERAQQFKREREAQQQQASSQPCLENASEEARSKRGLSAEQPIACLTPVNAASLNVQVPNQLTTRDQGLPASVRQRATSEQGLSADQTKSCSTLATSDLAGVPTPSQLATSPTIDKKGQAVSASHQPKRQYVGLISVAALASLLGLSCLIYKTSKVEAADNKDQRATSITSEALDKADKRLE